MTGFLDEVARAEHWLEAEVSSFLCHSDLGFQWFSFGGKSITHLEVQFAAAVLVWVRFVVGFDGFRVVFWLLYRWFFQWFSGTWGSLKDLGEGCCVTKVEKSM